ncbi:MAG: ectoine hydroxylase [Burkholderiaceae bacterium]
MTDTTIQPDTPLTTNGDRYPSRQASEPHITNRLDPVVYGRADGGPIDRKPVALLRRQRLPVHRAGVQRIRVGQLHAGTAPAAQRRTHQGDGRGRHRTQSRELRSVFEVHRSSDVLQTLCSHPRLVAMARQLLGSGVYIHQSRINYKSGFRGKEFFWHSDFETWHVEDGVPHMRMVSCSISLTPNTEHNGPLMLMPGSHHRFVSCVGETPADHYKASLKRQEVGVPDDASLTQLAHECGITSPKGPAGSVTFFDCNTMHGSNSNITPMPRSNVFVVYNSVENTPVAPFCGLAPRPNFIAERKDFTPLALPGEL